MHRHWLIGLLFLVLGAGMGRGALVKEIMDEGAAGKNLVRPEAWRPWQKGFEREGAAFRCANGDDAQVQRGATQALQLNQKAPAPIVAEAWSKAEGVTGSRNVDYALYLDLIYTDGTELWGQASSFSVGTHDWQKRRVVIMPAKPVKSLSMHLLMRRHGGTAWFREARLWELRPGAGEVLFDGVATRAAGPAREGFMVRDVAAGSGFHGDATDLGLKLESRKEARGGAEWIDAEIADTTGRDRALTLVYSVPAGEGAWDWLDDPGTRVAAEPGREYLNASRFNAGRGNLSRYPLGAVARGAEGLMLGIDAREPAFYRIAYNAGSRELFAAFDIGLSREKPSAKVRLLRASFKGGDGFRGALQRYYDLLPDCFTSRTPRQGLWMPFHAISKVEGWQDFGFVFKEGDGETAWDDAHGITTFRYTEPMTWWMRMDGGAKGGLDAALAEAKRRAEAGDAHARALLSSGYHDEEGRFAARLLDTPWCNGAVWSMNSMPGIAGEVTDWKLKWGPEVREKNYGAKRKGDLDGEYIDSSEGYVTEELDFRRDHFAAARFPLVYAPDSFKPAVFRGLIVAEYTRQMAADVHGMGKLMMANSTPSRLCWLAPWLDVMGTETDWHGSGKWRPMGEAELLYRRAMCGPKPFCFLMNTDFTKWSAELTEKYMRRCLAYGMFPGFFSANASTGHYFSQPALYNRDRELFKKYVPLCSLVAEAGWQPLTRAGTGEKGVCVERFGERFLTVFNDSGEGKKGIGIKLDGLKASEAKERVGGTTLKVKDGVIVLDLGAEEVAVLELVP